MNATRDCYCDKCCGMVLHTRLEKCPFCKDGILKPIDNSVANIVKEAKKYNKELNDRLARLEHAVMVIAQIQSNYLLDLHEKLLEEANGGKDEGIVNYL